MTEWVSLAVFLLGGLIALASGDPRIAASTSAIAYVLLLVTRWG